MARVGLEYRVGKARHDDRRHALRPGHEQLQTVVGTEANVGDQEIGRVFPHRADPVFEAAHRMSGVAGARQQLVQAGPRRVVVFDDQHSWRHRWCPGSWPLVGNPGRRGRLPQDRRRVVDSLTHHKLCPTRSAALDSRLPLDRNRTHPESSAETEQRRPNGWAGREYIEPLQQPVQKRSSAASATGRAYSSSLRAGSVSPTSPSKAESAQEQGGDCGRES